MPDQGFVGCFTHYGYHHGTWNHYIADHFYGRGPWSHSYLIHKLACVEGCRGVDNAKYAIYNSNPSSIYYRVCYCAHNNHVSKFGGIKNHQSECSGHNWVSFILIMALW